MNSVEKKKLLVRFASAEFLRINDRRITRIRSKLSQTIQSTTETPMAKQNV